MNHPFSVTIFCSSSNRLGETYQQEAKELGRAIAQKGWQIIYGGSRTGLMGQVAQAAMEASGMVVGVVPRFLIEREEVMPNLSAIHETDGLRERKARMLELGQSYVVLPGGLGTWDELFEVAALKQLGQLPRPLVVMNTLGYYSSLEDQFQKGLSEGFVSKKDANLIHFVSNPKEVIAYLTEWEEKRD